LETRLPRVRGIFEPVETPSATIFQSVWQVIAILFFTDA
jgi:hypothetical protein